MQALKIWFEKIQTAGYNGAMFFFINFNLFEIAILFAGPNVHVLYCTKVLIFCVEFLELSHLTHDLSQAEKKIVKS